MRSIYDLTMSELVDQYNIATHDLGINAVSKFKDLKTGQARLFAVIKTEEVNLPAKGEKKAAVKPAKKEAKKEAKPAKEKGGNNDEFGVRIGSNRNKMFLLLKKHLGKPVPVTKVIEAVYGAGADGLGPIAGVIKGCELTAPHGNATVTKEGKGKEMTLTLTPIKIK